MAEPRNHASPAGFRRTLTEQLRADASAGPWSFAQLQRHMAYDRLLERMYRTDGGWVVKGATALLARRLGVRGTIDIDVHHDTAPGRGEPGLRRAAARDLGDWFRFEVGSSRPVAYRAGDVRVPVVAFIGLTPWAEYHVDLVGLGLSMTTDPEATPPLAPVTMPTFEQHGYLVSPLVDHVADKVMGIVERRRAPSTPSTRFKDLVDLVAIAGGASVRADQQRSALQAEAERRDVALPQRFIAPDRSLWERGYAAEAARATRPVAQTLDAALAIASAFVDPLLDGRRTGTWLPASATWSDRDG